MCRDASSTIFFLCIPPFQYCTLLHFVLWKIYYLQNWFVFISSAEWWSSCCTRWKFGVQPDGTLGKRKTGKNNLGEIELDFGYCFFCSRLHSKSFHKRPLAYGNGKLLLETLNSARSWWAAFSIAFSWLSQVRLVVSMKFFLGFKETRLNIKWIFISCACFFCFFVLVS